MTPRIYTAAEARALREAAPAGPYEAWHPDDMPGRSVVVGGSERHPPYDRFVVGIDDKPRAALAELFAASPDLAATVEAQAAEIERLQRERDAATDLLAEVWHEIATGRPPSVSDRTAWLAQVYDVVGEASYCAALVAARDTLTRERDALRDAAREYLDARHNGLVALLAYLDVDPADAAARDAASACEARVTATRTRLAALVGDDATTRRDFPAEAVVSCARTRAARLRASASAASCGATAGPCERAETPTG